MTTQTSPAQPSQATLTLRNLYFTRTVVQFLWAMTVIATAAKNPTLGATLLILYPLWDVACTLYDLKTSAGSNSTTTQYANAAVGVLVAIGIGLTGYSHPAYAVAIFGGWALLAGLLQLAVGILRRQRLGGRRSIHSRGCGLRARRTQRQVSDQGPGWLRHLRRRLLPGRRHPAQPQTLKSRM